jgi:outer membrane protein OmpA-like peptidoglycan-associated protein
MRITNLILLSATVATLSGCATRGYVDESVAALEARQNAQLSAHEQMLEELSVTSRDALERATDAGVLAEGKFLYTVVLTDDGVTFGSGDAELTETGQQKLAQMANELKANNDNVYLEIQGHTDATGPEQLNYELGLKRAEAVRRYLYTQDVGLDRMATISYGEEEPLADNSTPAGRAANRRVSIVVLN